MSTIRRLATCVVGTLCLVWIGSSTPGCGEDETSGSPPQAAADSSPPVEGGNGSAGGGNGGSGGSGGGAGSPIDSGATKDATSPKKDSEAIEQDANSTADANSPLEVGVEAANPPSDFVVAYYINTDDSATTLAKIDWQDLKTIGITDIYLRVSNAGNYGEVYSALPNIKKETDQAGLRLHAWVFPGFSFAKEVASYGVGVHIDVENYHMADSVPELKKMRSDTTGQTFSICVKPHGYDGDQQYDLLAPICDNIVPMMYVGDYSMSLSSMAKSAKAWRDTYGDKFIFALETYESDKNTVAKSSAALLAEIEAVRPYVRGVALFRYSPTLSNFNGGISK